MPNPFRKPFKQRGRQQRGYALIQSVVMSVIFALLAIGILESASRGGDVITAKRRHDQSIACADAARELLHSQFSAFGLSPTQLTLNSVVGNDVLTSGHYGAVNVTSVSAASGAGGGSFGVTDISNRVASASLGGQTYRMTVVCSNVTTASGAPARQSEVEFLVKFGF